jgi:hypothetical protein
MMTLTSSVALAAGWRLPPLLTLEKDVIVFGNFYGHSGAGTGGSDEYVEHELLLGKAVLRLASFSSAPYFLCGDVQIDPRESEVLRSAIADGTLIDITLMHADMDKPPATYCSQGRPWEGMAGPGYTRIAAVFANKAGAAAVKSVKYEWDLACADHVPIGVELDTGIFDSVIREPLLPKPIDTSRASKATDDDKEEACAKVLSIYGDILDKAIAANDVNGAHEAWCDMATDYLIEMSGKEAPTNAAGTPARGRAPVFRDRRIVPKASGQLYGIDSYRLADWDITFARCTQLAFSP